MKWVANPAGYYLHHFSCTYEAQLRSRSRIKRSVPQAVLPASVLTWAYPRRVVPIYCRCRFHDRLLTPWSRLRLYPSPIFWGAIPSNLVSSMLVWHVYIFGCRRSRLQHEHIRAPRQEQARREQLHESSISINKRLVQRNRHPWTIFEVQFQCGDRCLGGPRQI